MSIYVNIKPGGQDTGTPLNVQRRIDLIGRYVDLARKRILDGGCGRGVYLSALLAFSPEVQGVECDAAKVAAFKSSSPFPEKIQVGNLEQLDFPDASFDFVLLNEVIEHVPNQDLVFPEALRVLKPGGMMAVFAPNRFFPFETHGVGLAAIDRDVSHLVPFIPYIPLAIGTRLFRYYARNYWPWELKRMVIRAGFVVTVQTYIGQTFEGISDRQPKMLSVLRPVLRKTVFLLERLPFLRVFGISQVLIARKPGG